MLICDRKYNEAKDENIEIKIDFLNFCKTQHRIHVAILQQM